MVRVTSCRLLTLIHLLPSLSFILPPLSTLLLLPLSPLVLSCSYDPDCRGYRSRPYDIPPGVLSKELKEEGDDKVVEKNDSGNLAEGGGDGEDVVERKSG